MSTDFALSKKVSAHDLFGERLKNLGIREHIRPCTCETDRCLTDGTNYLWVSITEDGFVALLSRYGANAPSKILSAIREAFDTEIYSEYEPQFWGFDTEKEWCAALKAMSDEDDNEFYLQVLAYVRGEPNTIESGTIGAIKAA